MDWNSAGQKSVSQQTAVTHLWTMDILGEEKKKKITIPRAGRNLVHGGVERGRERTKRDFRTDFLENLCFSYTAGCFVFLYKQKGSFLHISKSLLTPWAIGDGGTERGREKEMCVAAQKPWVTQTSGCTWTWPSPVASLRHLSWGLQVLPPTRETSGSCKASDSFILFSYVFTLWVSQRLPFLSARQWDSVVPRLNLRIWESKPCKLRQNSVRLQMRHF